jgi:kumamolisin
MTRVSLKGSAQPREAITSLIGKADPNERLTVTLLLRQANAAVWAEHIDQVSTKGGHSLSREAFARRFSASWSDIQSIANFAATYGLTVTKRCPERRTVILSGTVGQMNTAFQVTLELFDRVGQRHRSFVGNIYLPAELDGIVVAVLGLDNRPIARPFFRMAGASRRPSSVAAASLASFTPPQIASLYNFPEGAGAGECVGIVELGGGEVVADLSTYFTNLGITPTPTVTVVSVDQGGNSPGGAADTEVMLDIEIVGAIAPRAKIAVYFAPNTLVGFLDAIDSAIHDTTNTPSVISISWGGTESLWAEQELMAFDTAFQVAALMGVTVCAASGDNGGVVIAPSSSPYVLSCGGTTLEATASSITDETAWADGGGGVSTYFPLPSWQKGLQLTGISGTSTALSNRGVPDISGDADPNTGYSVRVDGFDGVVGGTSAVAPLIAGLIARINSLKGQPVGYINPRLYAASTALQDILRGNNGEFATATGWDACTGLGRPDGETFALVLGVLSPELIYYYASADSAM